MRSDRCALVAHEQAPRALRSPDFADSTSFSSVWLLALFKASSQPSKNVRRDHNARRSARAEHRAGDSRLPIAWKRAGQAAHCSLPLSNEPDLAPKLQGSVAGQDVARVKDETTNPSSASRTRRGRRAFVKPVRVLDQRVDVKVALLAEVHAVEIPRGPGVAKKLKSRPSTPAARSSRNAPDRQAEPGPTVRQSARAARPSGSKPLRQRRTSPRSTSFASVGAPRARRGGSRAPPRGRARPSTLPNTASSASPEGG